MPGHVFGFLKLPGRNASPALDSAQQKFGLSYAGAIKGQGVPEQAMSFLRILSGRMAQGAPDAGQPGKTQGPASLPLYAPEIAGMPSAATDGEAGASYAPGTDRGAFAGSAAPGQNGFFAAAADGRISFQNSISDAVATQIGQMLTVPRGTGPGTPGTPPHQAEDYLSPADLARAVMWQKNDPDNDGNLELPEQTALQALQAILSAFEPSGNGGAPVEAATPQGDAATAAGEATVRVSPMLLGIRLEAGSELAQLAPGVRIDAAAGSYVVRDAHSPLAQLIGKPVDEAHSSHFAPVALVERNAQQPAPVPPQEKLEAPGSIDESAGQSEPKSPQNAPLGGAVAANTRASGLTGEQDAMPAHRELHGGRPAFSPGEAQLGETGGAAKVHRITKVPVPGATEGSPAPAGEPRPASTGLQVVESPGLPDRPARGTEAPKWLQEMVIEVLRITGERLTGVQGQQYFAAERVAAFAGGTLAHHAAFGEFAEYLHLWHETLQKQRQAAAPSIGLGPEKRPGAESSPARASARPANGHAASSGTAGAPAPAGAAANPENAANMSAPVAQRDGSGTLPPEAVTPQPAPAATENESELSAKKGETLRTPVSLASHSALIRMRAAAENMPGRAGGRQAAELPSFEKMRLQILRQIRGSASRVQVQLRPAHLGQININFHLKGGSLQGSILVENAGVKKVLESGLDSLKAALQDKGIAVEMLEVRIQPQPNIAGTRHEPQNHAFQNQQQSGREAPQRSLGDEKKREKATDKSKKSFDQYL